MNNRSPFAYWVPRLEIEVEAIRSDRQVYILIRSVCLELGLELTEQVDRLQASTWTEVATLPMSGLGGSEDVDALPLEHLHMWLALLDADAVFPESRSGLLRLQDEVADLFTNQRN